MFAVKFAFQACCTQFQIQVNGIRQAEAVDDTCIESSGIGMRTWIRMSPTGTDIRDDFIYTVRIVTAEKCIQVNHQVTVQVHIVPPLFVWTVSSRTAHYIIGSFVGRESFSLQTAVLHTQSESRSHPFTDRHIKCRSNTVSEFTDMVIVAIQHLCTSSDGEEPVTPERVRYYLIFILHLNNLVFSYSHCLLRRSDRRNAGKSQQHQNLFHIPNS